MRVKPHNISPHTNKRFMLLCKKLQILCVGAAGSKMFIVPFMFAI